MLGLQQPLWTGGRISSAIAGAESRYGASEKSIHESEETVLLTIVNAFSEAARWQTRKTISADSLQQHTKLFDMIKRRVNAEASPAIDLELAQGRLYQAEIELAYAEQMLQSAVTQLSQLAGVPIKSVVPSGVDKLRHIESSDACIDAAQGWSPVLARLTHEVDAAEAEVGIKKSVYWPQLGVRYEKNTGPTVYNVDRVMLTMDMQFGAGFSAVSGVNAARARWDAAKLERERVVRELAQQVALDWMDYTTARTRVDQAAKATLSANTVFDSYTRQYTAGRKSWLDVLNAVREASQSKGMLADAYAQMSGAGMRLLVMTGKINPQSFGQ
jgi:adhesin transport system outer membrane protein